MSIETRPRKCPLYPEKPSGAYKVLGTKYVVKDLGVAPLPRTKSSNPPCLAFELPKWNPNQHNRGACQRCRREIDINPASSPWGKT